MDNTVELIAFMKFKCKNYALDVERTADKMFTQLHCNFKWPPKFTSITSSTLICSQKMTILETKSSLRSFVYEILHIQRCFISHMVLPILLTNGTVTNTDSFVLPQNFAILMQLLPTSTSSSSDQNRNDIPISMLAVQKRLTIFQDLSTTFRN